MTNNFLPERVLRRNRALSELMELCREVIADGKVTETEMEAFRSWVDANPDMIGISPVSQLVPTLRGIFEDGVVSGAEREQFLALLERMTGEDGNTTETMGRLHRPPAE